MEIIADHITYLFLNVIIPLVLTVLQYNEHLKISRVSINHYIPI